MAEAELPQVSLFERIGGREAVSRIVESFYVRVEGDTHMRPIYPEDLEPGKEKLKLFLEQWMGGEPRYSQLYGHPRLRRRHFPFVIDELAAGRWLRHMREAMTEHGVSAEEQGVIFQHLGPLAHHMVNASEDVPRERLGEIRLQ
jgi:hemoglobin